MFTPKNKPPLLVWLSRLRTAILRFVRPALSFVLRSSKLAVFVVALTGVLLYTRGGTPARVEAAVPSTLNFQARLLGGNGAIAQDGIYNVEFKLYDDESAGSNVWTETRLTSDPANQQVVVKNGYLSVYLGDKTAMTGINWDDQLWLTMNIGGTGGSPTWDGEMTPRLRLTSVPYAIQAQRAESLAKTVTGNLGQILFPGSLGQATNYNFVDPGQANVDVCLSTGNCGGAGVTLQTAYNNSNPARIVVNGTNGGLQIRDNAVPTGGSLFAIQDNGGTATYLNVDATGTTVAGNLTVGDASSDTLTINAASTFNTDATFTFAGSENLAVTSDLDGSVNVLSVIATPSATAGTTTGLFVQQADSANGNGLDSALTIDNADADLAINDAINITNTGGGGYTNFLNTPSIDITGAGAITGATGIATTGNFAQSGSGTFATGTGAVTLNGAVSVSGSNTLTVGTGATTLGGTLTVAGLATFNGGLTVTSGQQLTNAGSSLFTAINISDVAAGGDIGTAAATVDVATTFNVNQTTTAQTLTLPNPTSSVAGRIVYVVNVGSEEFMMYNVGVKIGGAQSYIWNGTTWVPGSIDGAGTGITGTGANGRVAYFNSSNTLTSSANFLFNGTNLTLGGDLNVNGGDIASTTSLNVTASNGALTLVSTGGGNNIVLDSANTIELQDSTNVTGNLDVSGTLTVGSSNQLQVDASGNLDTTGNVEGAVLNATTGFRVNGAATAGQYLRGDGTNVILSALLASDLSGTIFNTAGDTGTGTLTTGETISILGGTNGIDTVLAGDTVTLNLDTSEIGTTTFGSGTGFTWTFDAGATDPQIGFASDAVTVTAGTTTFTGNLAVNGGSITSTTNLTIDATGYVRIGDTGTPGFASGDDDLYIEGDLEVDANTQLGGTLAVIGTSTFTGTATFNGGLVVTAGQQFTNAGSSLFAALTISDVAAGGDVETAANSVDIATTLNIDQTTATQVLTLPDPTSAVAGRVVFVNNVGSEDFTMYGVAIPAGYSQSYIWNGTDWRSTGIDTGGNGAGSVGTLDGQTKVADGGVITANQLFLQTADAVGCGGGGCAGLVSAGAQAFAGAKTFNGGVIVAGGQSIQIGGDTITDLVGTGLTLNGTTLEASLGTSVDLATAEVTGTLAVANGGTGATTLTGILLGNGTSPVTALTTSAGIAGAISDETGTGSLVFSASPTLTGTVNVAALTSSGLITANSLTVTGAATFNGGLAITAGQQFTNAGSSLFAALNISNVAGGGDIGTAATTVDVATTFNINQTTSSQTLTLDDPTSAVSGRIVYVNNVGNTAFTMYGVIVAAGRNQGYIWNGTAWTALGVDSAGAGVTGVGTIDTQTKSANGAVVDNNLIYLQTADAVGCGGGGCAGLVSAGSQTFAGAKTFNGGIIIASSQSIQIGGDTITDLTGTGLQMNGTVLETTLGTSVNLASAEVTGTLPVANGGTGATTLTGILLGNGTSPVTALTTSAGIAGAISDETGTGSLVFSAAPTFTGTLSAVDINLSGDITVAGGSVTVGAAGQAGVVVLYDGQSGGSANTLTLDVEATLGQNTTITFPDPGTSTAEVCYRNDSNCGFALTNGGSFIQFAPNTAQENNTAFTTAFIDNTNGADFIELQSNGSTVFLIENDGSVTTEGNVAVNGGQITSTNATATLFNTTVTDLSIGGAATTITIGAATGTTTINNNLDVNLGLTVGNSNQFTINATGAITAATGINSSGTIRFSALTTNGLLRTTGGNGTVSVATAGTDYEVPLTFGNGLTRNTNAVSLGGNLTGNTSLGLTSGSFTLDGTATDVVFGTTGNIGIGTASNANNKVAINTATTSNAANQAAQVLIATGADANSGLIIQSNSVSQSADPFVIQNSAGTRVFSVGALGQVVSSVGLHLNSAGAAYISKVMVVGTGGITQNGVVVMDNTGQAVETTTARDIRVYGISTGNASSGANGVVALSGGFSVKFTGTTPVAGDQLVTSTVAGAVMVDNNATQGIVGFATAGGSGGLVALAIRPVNGVTNATFNGNVTVAGSNGITFSGVTNDINTGTNEDLTVVANGTGRILLNDTVRVSTLTTGGLVKSDNNGELSNATAGTDYEVPLTFTNGLTRNTNAVSLGGNLTGNTSLGLSSGTFTLDGSAIDTIFGTTGNIGINTTPTANNKLAINAANTADTAADVIISSGGANNKALVLQANASQAASSTLFDIQASNGGSLFSVNSNGTVNASNYTVVSSANSGSYNKAITAGSTGIGTSDVVIQVLESGNYRGITTTTARDIRVMGVANTGAAAGIGTNIRILGNATVNYTGTAPTAGDQLVTSTVAGAVMVDNTATQGIVGIAVSNGAAGTVSIFVRPVNGVTNATFNGNVTVAGANGITFSGATNDINTGTNEDLTVTANGTGRILLNDTVRVSTLTTGGLVKSDNNGELSNAVAGTDYENPLTFSNGLTRTSNAVALGGNLTGATSIGLNSQTLSFTGSNGNIQFAATGSATFGATGTGLTVTNDASIGGDLAVNGGDITSTTSLNVTASSGALTLTSTGASNDIIVNSGRNIELQDSTNVTGNLDVSGSFTVGGSNQFNINNTGAITAATGITSSGTVTFSGLTANRFVGTTTGGELTTALTSADLAASLSNETGTGLVVFNDSPTILGTLDVVNIDVSGNLVIGGDTIDELVGSGLALSSGDLTVDASSATGFFRNGGNNFGGNATLGTNGANQTLTLETANVARFIIDDATSTLAGQGATVLSSTGTLAITPGGALTVGATTQTALLQGSTTTITSTGAGNDITLTSADQIILNSAGTIELQDNTNVTGTLDVTGNLDTNGTLTVGSSGQFTVSAGGAITAATGITSSGNITFSGLTAGRFVGTTTGGQLTTALTSADLAASLSNETGTGVAVFATSPQFTTQVTTNSSSFDVFNTNATTINAFGAATSLTIGATSGTLTVRNDNLDLSAANPTISATATNSDLRLQANGTGEIELLSDTNLTGSLDVSVGLTVGTSDAFQVDSSGRIFAPNGASGAGNLAFSFVNDTDTGFYRSGTNELRVQTNGTDRLTIAANGNIGVGTSTTTSLLSIGTNTTTAAGGILFGTDVNLYRSAANELTTDDHLFSGAQVAAERGGAAEVRIGAIGPSGQAAIVFGYDQANPVNLYRSAANELTTEDNFNVQGDLFANGDVLFDSTLTVAGDVTLDSELTVDGATTLNNTLTVNGAASVNITDATAFQVTSTAGAEVALTVDTTARSGSGGNLVKIGNSTGTDGATTLLQLDGATSNISSNLTVLNGGLYFNNGNGTPANGRFMGVVNNIADEFCIKTLANCSGGTGGVGGTAVSGQIAYFNGTNTITGSTNFLYDGTTFGANAVINLNTTGSAGTNIGTGSYTGTVAIGNANSTTTVLGTLNLNATGTATTNLGATGTTTNVLGTVNVNNSGAGTTNIGASGTGNTTVGNTTGTLTLQSGAAGIVVNTSLLSRTAAGTLALDLVDGADTTLALQNSGAGVANLTIDGDLAVNGGDITSSGALNITPGGALTVGATTQTALLQGSTTTITSTGATNDITLTSADQIILNSTGTIELQDNTNVTGNFDVSGTIFAGTGNAFQVSAAGEVTYVGATSDTATLVCRNSLGQLAACQTNVAGSAYVQGGNTYGATGTLGLTDDNNLNIVTNGTTRLTVQSTTNGGNVIVANDLAVNGGDITSTGALNISPGGALTLGVTGQAATLQGTTVNITSNTAGNDITLTSADQIILNATGTIELQDTTNITGDLHIQPDAIWNFGDAANLYLGDTSSFLRNSNGGGLQLSSNSTVDINTTSASSITLSPNGSIAVTILSGGNVGIGDTTPVGLLTVGNGDLFQINASGDVTTANGENLSVITGTTGSLTLDTGTTGAINIGTNANAKDITIGNATGATNVDINVGTGNLNVTGNSNFNGNASFGNEADVDNPGQLIGIGSFSSVVDVAHTFTDLTSTGYVSGITNAIVLNPSAPATAGVIGSYTTVSTEVGNAQDFQQITASGGSVTYNGSGTAVSLQGTGGSVTNAGTGIVNTADGLVGSFTNNSGATTAIGTALHGYTQNDGTVGAGAGLLLEAVNNGIASIIFTGINGNIQNSSSGTTDELNGIGLTVTNEGTATTSVDGSNLTVDNSGTTTDLYGNRIRVENSGTVSSGLRANDIEVTNTGDVTGQIIGSNLVLNNEAAATAGGIAGNLITINNDSANPITSIGGLGITVNNTGTGVVTNTTGLAVAPFTNTGGGSMTDVLGIVVYGQTVGAQRNIGLSIFETSGGANANANLALGSLPVSGNYSIYNSSTDANLFAGQLIFSGNIATDITTSANQDLTVLANGTGDVYLDSGSDSVNVGTNTTTAVVLGNAANNSTVTINTGNGAINIGDTTGTKAIDLGGNDANAADTIRIATNSTSADAITIGSINSGSTLILEAGTAATAIQIGNGATAHGIQIGTDATTTQTLRIGSTSASSTTLIQGGTGASAISLQPGVGGTVSIGASAGSGTTFLNNGATLNATLAVANDADGGVLGGGLTAAQSVNIYTSFAITQTTPGMTITIPSPTNTAAGRIIYIANTSTNSTSFTLLGATVNAGSTATLFWNGTAWTFAGADGSSILNQNSADQTANFRISGVGRANSGLLAPSLDVVSGTLTIGTGATTGSAVATAITIGSNTTSGATSTTINAGTGGITIATGNNGAGTAGNITIDNGTSTIGTPQINIGTSTSAHTIALGNSSTAAQGITIGSVNSGSTLILEAGTAATAIQIGNGATAHGIQIGTDATTTQTLRIGSTSASSTTLIQGGTGASAISLQTGAGGIVSVGASAGSGTTLLNNGSTVNTVLNITSAVGTFGANTATVNIYTAFAVNSTAASQVFTVPTPTANTTYGRIIYVTNIGTNSFTFANTYLTAVLNQGATATLIWANVNGVGNWTYAGADGGAVLNQNANSQSANFRISGVGQASGFDINASGTLNIGTATTSGQIATGIQIGNNTNNTAITISSGTGAIAIGTGGQARTVSIATGAADQDLTLGAVNGTSSVTINTGTGTANGDINIGDSAVNGKRIDVGSVETGNSTAVNIATNNGATQTIQIGGTFGAGGSSAASSIKLQGGTVGIDINAADSGGVTLQSFTNDSNAFRILTASGAGSPLLVADTAHTTPRILIGNPTIGGGTLSTAALVVTTQQVTTTLRLGDSTNAVLFNDISVTGGASGKLRFIGTAKNDVNLTLIPEFQGATLTGDGSDNIGTMTSDFCSNITSPARVINASNCGTNNEHNYYQWTTTQGSAQDYDVYVRWQVPSNFDTNNTSDFVLSASGYRSSINDDVTVSVFDYNDGTASPCGSNSITGSNGWNDNASVTTSSCVFRANDTIVFRIRLRATNANFARMGEINISYKAVF